MEAMQIDGMQERYAFHEIESRWQRIWDERGTFHAPDADPRPKLYVLQMFPYPSGDLHAGHVRNYVLGDAVARYFRMRGYNVMHPMGFDSFGLPAEQAAIDRNIQPRNWIASCVSNSRRQFKRYGFSFDWQREVVTSEPDYYRWTQWLFAKFFDWGLVYRKEVEVNWCEEHGVLANDEVKEGGCWRCDRPVRKKKLAQWLMRTTDYAESLLSGLDQLPGWNEAVRTMQRNWIGRSEGTNIDFAVPALASSAGVSARDSAEMAGTEARPTEVTPVLTVFTTRVDTIFGCTFMAIAPDHPLAAAIAQAGGMAEALARFKDECAREAVEYGVAEEKPKKGLRLGVDCVNPFNNEAIPIFATNYVVSDFGTGAVMAVPAHDARDHAFALEYGLPIRDVIIQFETHAIEVDTPEGRSAAAKQALESHRIEGCFTEKGICINSGEFDGLDFAAAKAAMDAWLSQRGLGGATVQYRLRDWNMSRQRFWGAPLPMVHCDKPEAQGGCGWQRVPDMELPVRLPDLADYSDIKVSPLANDHAWQRAHCPKCGGRATRETDTMTTFMDSAWYFLRYCDPQNEHAIFDPVLVQAWLPVDYYVGGKEHAVGHLLYSRFITQVLARHGLIDLTRAGYGDERALHDEPFRRLFNQGIVHKDGAKMSKSKGNVVSADELAETYGADTARLFSFFGGPYDMDLEWSKAGVEGCHRFLKRVWRLAFSVSQAQHARGEEYGQHDTQAQQAVRARHRAVAGVSADLQAWRFNTAIAKLMEYLNELEELWRKDDGIDDGRAFHSAMQTMAQLLCPFAPHIAEELWERLGGYGLCCDSEWPEHDPAALLEDSVEYPVQVNGKLRGKISVPSAADADAVLAFAKADPAVAKWLEGKALVKEIVVPGRMVTFVVR